MADFEVIVVGAGPAGAMLTKELAERNFAVACIEREREIGYTNKSTAATPLDTFETFDIPRNLGFDDLGGFRFQGPTELCIKEFGGTIGRVLMFREVKQYLVKEAIRAGATVVLGATVIDIQKESGRISGIKYRGITGEDVLTTDVVVDASGPEAVLATKLGLWEKRPEQLGVAFEYFLENAKPDRGAYGFYLDFFMGSRYAPGGYAWIFATKDHQVKAGICKLNPNFKISNEKSQVEYLHELWHENPQIKGAQPFEIHECAHYITGGVEHATLELRCYWRRGE